MTMKASVPTRTIQSSALMTPTNSGPRRTAPAPPAPQRATGRGCARSREAAAALHPRAGARRDPPTRVSGDQVGEEAIGAGDTGRELPKEREAGVDIAALPVARHQHSAEQRILARVGGAEDRLVAIVPRLAVVEAALLHPAVEVRRG